MYGDLIYYCKNDMEFIKSCMKMTEIILIKIP